MRAVIQDKKQIVSLLILLLSVVIAVYQYEPLWMIIPFAWILILPAYRWIMAHPDQLFWIWLIALPLSTEWQITKSLGLDFPGEPLLIILTGLLFLLLWHAPTKTPGAVLDHPLVLLLITHMGWILISALYSDEPVLSVKYFLAKAWYVIPLLLLPQWLLQTKQHWARLAACLLLPMGFVLVLTLIRHAASGFSFESVNHILYPFFRNHVNYSSMLVCLLPLVWAVWMLSAKGSVIRKWILLCAVIGLAGLFFAYARSAWLALIAGMLSVYVIRFRKMQWVIGIAILAIFISSAWLITDRNYMQFAPDHDRTVFHTDFSEHMKATVEGKDVSTAERFYRWVAGVRMLAEKPVTGFGPNSFYLHYRPYTVTAFETWVSDNKEHSTVHNYFLLLALEQGLPGLIIFCLLYFAMLLEAQRLYHSFQSRFYRTVALVSAIVLVMIGVINSMSDMIETDKIGGLFWLLLGVLICLRSRSEDEKRMLAVQQNETLA
jgi:O-antigen ligase